MASLTPLSKGLIGLVVLGGMASAVWHLYLKERMAGATNQPIATVSQPTQQQAPAMPSGISPAQSPAPSPAPTTEQAPAPTATLAPPAKTVPASGLSAAENAETGRKLLSQGNFAQARVHLERAVQDGDAAAACLLGDMTLKGQGGIAASQDKAAKLFQLAQSRNTICFSAGQ